MRLVTENQIITQLNKMGNSGTLCAQIIPRQQLSSCAMAALREFVKVNICQNPTTGLHLNYAYLIDILAILNTNTSLLLQSDAQIWANYKLVNPQAPGSSHQLPGLAKTLIKGRFYP